MYFGIVGVIASFGAYEIARTTLHGSIEYSIILWTIVVGAEDLLRTWFVVNATRRGMLVITSALAFSIAASFLETVAQLHDLVLVAVYTTLEEEAEVHEFYRAFFSSYVVSLVTLCLYFIRPVVHFLLCVSMYEAWKMRRWLIYSLLIASHIALDVAIDRMVGRDPINSTVPIFVLTLLFMLLLLASMWWMRTAAKQRSASSF